MEALGQALRERRLALGLSLESVHEQTRIRQAHLEAIEAGELDRLPGVVYARAFVKRYAEVVGLELDEADLAALQPGVQPPARPSVQERLSRRREERRRKALRAGAALAIVMALGFVWMRGSLPGWLRPSEQLTALEGGVRPERESPSAPTGDPGTQQSPTRAPEQPSTSQSAEPSSTDPDEVPASADDGAAQPEQSVTPDLPPAEPAPPLLPPSHLEGLMLPETRPAEPVTSPVAEPTLQLVVFFDDDSWTEAWVDGARTLYRTVSAGERTEWEAEQAIRLRFGRGHAVRLELNGVDLGTPGVGVVDLLINRETLDEMRGTLF